MCEGRGVNTDTQGQISIFLFEEKQVEGKPNTNTSGYPWVEERGAGEIQWGSVDTTQGAANAGGEKSTSYFPLTSD